jgi:hypothetical protein
MTIEVKGSPGETLAIIDGESKLVHTVDGAWTEWNLRETNKGWTIQKAGNRKKDESRYLAVDKKGKVKLVAEPGEGAYWMVIRNGEDATIQVSGGKFGGWYLEFSEEGQQLKRGSRFVKTYDPQLSETSGGRANLHIFLDGK